MVFSTRLSVNFMHFPIVVTVLYMPELLSFIVAAVLRSLPQIVGLMPCTLIL